MKEKIKFLFLSTFIANASLACDVCGGAINTGGSDVIPGLYRHFIGFRGSVQSFSSEHLTLFPGELPIESDEWFVNKELFGRYVPIRRIHINGFVPFNTVYKVESDEELKKTQGIGDIRLSTNVLLLEKAFEVDEELKSEVNWFFGAGVKLPTGKYKLPADESIHFHPNMLPGTGTTDFFVHSDFLFSKNNWGSIVNATYMYRGTNSNQYRFGDLFSSRLTGYYKYEPKEKHTIMLELGFLFSSIQSDEDLRWNEEQPYSEGWMTAPSFRISYFVNDWALQLGGNKALFQNLALGQVKQNYQFEFSIIRFL